jgi:hypothetical protein
VVNGKFYICKDILIKIAAQRTISSVISNLVSVICTTIKIEYYVPHHVSNALIIFRERFTINYLELHSESYSHHIYTVNNAQK